MKRSKLDIIFSDLVRERAEWSCEFPGCNKLFPEGETAGLDCSHIEGRRARGTRWHPDNAMAMCKFHHRYLGENPLFHADLVRKNLGEQRYVELKRRAHGINKFTARQLEGLYQHYLDEYARMAQARVNGRLGRIDFSWPEVLPEAEPRKRKAKKPSLAGPKKKIPGKPFVKGKYVKGVDGEVRLRGTKVDGKRDERAA